MKFVDPRIDILPRAQLELWPHLANLEHGFVLYGGTAVALHFGHRESVDFDFFTENEFDPSSLKEKYDFLKEGKAIQLDNNTLTVLASTPHGIVKCSFFGGVKFGRADMPSVCRDTLVRLASPLDLAVQKLLMVVKRSEVKDYKDLDCLFSNGVHLADAMGIAPVMIPELDPAIALRGVCYFEGGDVHTLAPEAKKRLTEQVASFTKPTPRKIESAHLDIPRIELESLQKEKKVSQRKLEGKDAKKLLNQATAKKHKK